MLKNDSFLIKKTRCPRCASLGKDTSKDNLAIYSDGHEWCYSCGFYKKGNKIKKLQQLPKKELEVVLPLDCSFDYPQRALQWIEQYGLSRTDLLAHRVMWSDWSKRLYFPVFAESGLLAYQGRYFGEDKGKPKWWGQGDLKNVHHYLLTKPPGDSIILCEDIVSAIKIQKAGYNSMPLFGSHIDVKRLSRLAVRFYKVGIYLDPDKRKEALKFALLGRSLGLDTWTIFSNKDPKEEPYDRLSCLLKEKVRQVC